MSERLSNTLYFHPNPQIAAAERRLSLNRPEDTLKFSFLSAATIPQPISCNDITATVSLSAIMPWVFLRYIEQCSIGRVHKNVA